jgi:predicted PP-loop superfamily ATPase
MAFLRHTAALTTGIRASTITTALSGCYRSAAVVGRRLMHTEESPAPSLVPPEVRCELNRVEEDCIRRHREVAADLAKLHDKVRGDYSTVCNQGESTTSFRMATWLVFASVLLHGVLITLGRGSRQLLLSAVEEMRAEVEANLESVITEKTDAARAGAFVSTK